MVLFNSDNFKEINYLNFDIDFEIALTDKIKIILGPNGTGKTSLYKNIRDRFNDFSFIDYNDVAKSVIAKKGEIIIGASIVSLVNKEKEKSLIIEEINVKDNLKKFNITNKTSANAISATFEELRKNPEKAIESFNNNNLKNIFDMKKTQIDFFDENAKTVIELEKIETELKDIKNNYKKKLLEEVNNYLENDDNECPVCGTVKDVPIKDIIAKKMLEIKDITDEVVKKYQEKHLNLKPEEILKDIEEMKATISNNNITISNLENYLICGGDKDKANNILESQKKLIKLNKEISILEKEKDEFYKNLEIQKQAVISTFKLQFEVDEQDISFDDANKLLKIKLPRKIEEYSTGEINLITFIICILEFIASDKSYLIIDDPLSSYDIPNQYKIMYEIASAKSDLKNILILTHNVDTVNIANSQYCGMFEYETLEKRKATLFLNKITCNSTDNVLSIDTLLRNIDKSYPHLEYVKLLMEKETWDDNIPDEFENHLIFHYDENFKKTIESVDYDNDYLVSLIDNFDDNSFKNVSYLENTANKIIYTSALRVWIEKQFYLNNPNDSGLFNKQFGDKIRYIFKDNRWKGSSKVTKQYLMSKKVMLNQHNHTNSQIMPFYYALNLSLDDIAKEIGDIKDKFKSEDF